MKKCVQNMKEYEEMCGKYEGRAPPEILALENIPSFPPLYKLFYLENFRALPFIQIQPFAGAPSEARCEMSPF